MHLGSPAHGLNTFSSGISTKRKWDSGIRKQAPPGDTPTQERLLSSARRTPSQNKSRKGQRPLIRPVKREEFVEPLIGQLSEKTLDHLPEPSLVKRPRAAQVGCWANKQARFVTRTHRVRDKNCPRDQKKGGAKKPAWIFPKARSALKPQHNPTERKKRAGRGQAADEQEFEPSAKPLGVVGAHKGQVTGKKKDGRKGETLVSTNLAIRCMA